MLQQHHWRKWLQGDKVNFLSQVIAHALCRVHVTRSTMVIPNSGVTWQDLEHDGVVFILSPGDFYFSPCVS